MSILSGLATGVKWFLSLLFYIEPNIPHAERKERNPIQRFRVIPIMIIILMAAAILYLRLNFSN